MPIPKDYRDILNSLAGKSENGQVNWKSNRFGVEVAVNESKFLIWAGTDEETGEPFVSFALHDLTGKTLDSWFVDGSDYDYDFMSRLHNSAKRHALGIPQRLAELKDIIEKASVVGDQKQPK